MKPRPPLPAWKPDTCADCGAKHPILSRDGIATLERLAVHALA